MKVLFVCHRLPYPPSRGGKIRPFNIIRHLAKRHEVTVASLARSNSEADAGAPLASHCHRVLVERITPAAAMSQMLVRLPTREPSSAGYFYSSALARRIDAEVEQEKFDLIFVHCAFVAPYVAEVRGPRKILDFGDMDSQKWLAYAKARRRPLALGYGLEGAKLQRLERRLAAQFDLCTCTTQAELATLRSYGVSIATGWFPNGVDCERFQPSDDSYQPDSLVFVGRMDYFPNQQSMLDFCRTTLPLVQARRPGTTLAIVGADPSRAIKALGKLPGVTVTGSVPDVRPYVQRAAVAVAPLKIARGTQNKILETMAMGVPTVASMIAAGGVDAEPGRHFLTAATPREFADAIVRLFEDPGERRKFAEAGRARMLSHHRWERSLEMLDQLINGVTAQ
jgi:sugar transferase (PEP-CTERM/EpsH1 system associated)